MSLIKRSTHHKLSLLWKSDPHFQHRKEIGVEVAWAFLSNEGNSFWNPLPSDESEITDVDSSSGETSGVDRVVSLDKVA